MNAAEILQLKNDLGDRLEVLRRELNIEENDLKPHFEELDTFRASSGFFQVIYYLYQYDRIRAAVEYEALVQLYEQPLAVTPEEDDLLEVFDEGIPNLPFKISDKLAPHIETLKQSLYIRMTASSVLAFEKEQALTQFWLATANLLEKSESVTDRVLGRYIKTRQDLGVKTKPIHVGPVKESANAPQFILDLKKSSGTKDEFTLFSNAYGEDEAVKPAPPAQHIYATVPPELPIQVQTQTYLFWWIPCFLMSDIQTAVEERQDALNQARHLINEVKNWAAEYFRPVIDGYKSLFNGWKNIKSVSTKPIPEELALTSTAPPSAEESPSAVTKMINYAASFLPATTTPTKEEVVPVTVESSKSWWSFS